jgi:hypothetical protein
MVSKLNDIFDKSSFARTKEARKDNNFKFCHIIREKILFMIKIKVMSLNIDYI